MHPNDFDKHFAQTRRIAIIGLLMSFAISVAVIGGLGWVAYRLVIHFTGN